MSRPQNYSYKREENGLIQAWANHLHDARYVLDALTPANRILPPTREESLGVGTAVILALAAVEVFLESVLKFAVTRTPRLLFDLLEGKEGLPTNVVREALPGRVTVRELFERLLFERFQRAPLPAKFRLVRKVTRNIRELESVQTALEQVEPWRHAFAHRAEIVTELPQVEFAPWYGPKSVSSDECERELNRLDEAVRLLGDVVTEEFRVRIIYALGKGSETAASRCLPWGKYPVVCVRLPPERQLDQAKMKDHAVALVVDREIAEDRSRFALLLHEIDSDPVLSRLRSSACVWAWHSPSEALRSALTQEKMVVVADEQELREFLEPLLRSATTQQRPTLGPTPDVGA